MYLLERHREALRAPKMLHYERQQGDAPEYNRESGWRGMRVAPNGWGAPVKASISPSKCYRDASLKHLQVRLQLDA